MFEYQGLTHADMWFAGFHICEPPTLLHDSMVVSDVASTIQDVWYQPEMATEPEPARSESDTRSVRWSR